MKKFSFEINGGEYEVDVKSIEDGFAELEVNGTPYSVKINEISGAAVQNLAAVRPAAPKAAAATAAGAARKIKSPLPGSVVKVNVGVGDSFKEGDVLMIMESMKMENNILAEFNGVVAKICANAGAAVLQDEVLFEVSESGGAPAAQSAAVAPKTAPAATPTPAPAPSGKGSKSVKSPLPGSVVKVNVGVGDSFKEGDVLMIMESMKMENNILAESSGVVAKVCFQAGAAVLQDEVLFEYE